MAQSTAKQIDMTEKQAKTVLYLITKSNWGGAQRYVYDLATHLDEVWRPVVGLGGTGALRERLEAAHVAVRQIGSLKRDINLCEEVKSFWSLLSLIRDVHPDVLHVNSAKASGLGALAGRILGVPRIIFTAHGWAFNESRPNWQKPILKFLSWLTMLLAHETLAVSDATGAQVRDWPLLHDRITLVRLGIEEPTPLDRDRAREILHKRFGLFIVDEPDTLWACTIGELHPIKGHQVLLRALAEQPGLEHLHVTVLGDGELKAELEDLTQAYGLTERVHFVGHVPDAAMYLPAFDLFIHPSFSEAASYATIEAAFSGTPIIASRVGGVPEIITDRVTGRLFPAGDSKALGAVLHEHICTPEYAQTMAEAARLHAHATFNLSRMVAETERSYRER